MGLSASKLANLSANPGIAASVHKAVKRPLIKTVDSTLRKDLFGNQVMQSNPFQRFMASQASSQMKTGGGIPGPYGATGFSHIFQHLSNMVTGEMFGAQSSGKKLFPIIEPGGALRIGSSTYGPSNLLDLRDKRARELQSFAFLTRSHLRMIERYKKREEEVKNDPLPEATKAIAEKKAIQTLALGHLESLYQRTKLNSYENKILMIQKHWRAYLERQRFKAMHSPKTTVLWRVHRTISVYRGDKWLKEIHIVAINLTNDESHVEIKTKPIDHKTKANWCHLRIPVKELVEYFDIGKDELLTGSKQKFEELTSFGFSNLKDGAFHKRREERIRSIRSFTSCFLDSLLIENQQLKFNQRKKLQKLIELLNDDSVLYMSDLEASSTDSQAGKDDLSGSVLSSAGLALKKNNYEQYLDTITTRVQKRVKGFLARKRFQMIKKVESVKFFEAEINQDGEDLYLVLMKRVVSGHFTAFAYNFSTGKFFNQFVVRNLPERAKALTDPKEVGRAILELIVFDLDRDMMYYHDYYMSSPDIEDLSSTAGFQEQKTKVDRFLELYRVRCKNNFKKKGFALETRYTLQGKKFVEHKGIPLNILLFVSDGGKTIRLDVLRMDTRQFAFMKVYACKGEYMSHVVEGNRLYESMQLVGDLEPIIQEGMRQPSATSSKTTFDIVYESKLLEKIESEFGSRQFELIRGIQRHFKNMKMKESFWGCFGDKQFKMEVYFLDVTERILIKALDKPPEEVVDRVSKDKIYSSMKLKNSDETEKEKKLQLSQMIVLNFQELHLPVRDPNAITSNSNSNVGHIKQKTLTSIPNLKEDSKSPKQQQSLLTDEQITEFIRYIIFKKLRYDEEIKLEPFTQEETHLLLNKQVSDQNGQKSHWDPPKFTRMASLNQSLEDLNLQIELESKILGSANRGLHDVNDGVHEGSGTIELLPTLKWDFNLNSNEVVEEEEPDVEEPVSPPPDSTDHMPAKVFQQHALARTKFAEKVAKAYNTFMKHKMMKPKLFAVHSFNSLRQKNQKRLTIPVAGTNDDYSVYESNRSRGGKENHQRRSSVGPSVTPNEDQLHDLDQELEMNLLAAANHRSSRIITIPEQLESSAARKHKRVQTFKDSEKNLAELPQNANAAIQQDTSVDHSSKPEFRIKESPIIGATRRSAKIADQPMKNFSGGKSVSSVKKLLPESSVPFEDDAGPVQKRGSKPIIAGIMRLPSGSVTDSQKHAHRPNHFKFAQGRSGSGIASESLLNLDTPDPAKKDIQIQPQKQAQVEVMRARTSGNTSKPRKSSIRIKTDKMSIEGYDAGTPRDSQASKFRIIPNSVQPKNPPPSPDKRAVQPSQNVPSNTEDNRRGSFNFFTQLRPTRTISSQSELG